MDTIASGAVKYVNTLTAVTSLLGTYPASSANAGKPFVFNTDVAYPIEGTGAVALVFGDAGTYSVARGRSTALFFRLSVTVWADPARDSAGNITEGAGKTIARGKKVWQVLNTSLHRVSADSQNWGDMVTVSSELLSGPHFFAAEDVGAVGGGSGRTGTTSRPQIGLAYYGVGVFGYTDVVS